jgi:endonuclease/exonuclease/phosphatase family metal-dependent hydrolase
VSLLVRTWNVFHGRTVPEGARLELERMVRLVTEDGPALVALQEVPVWALERLPGWSGMRVVGAIAMPAFGGPLARRLTALDPRRLRSALVGQANVLLFGPGIEPAGGGRVVRLNPAGLRRGHAGPLRERLEWARNRRVAHVVEARAGVTPLTVVNLHASREPRLARLELERLGGLLPGGPAIVLGDLNARGTGLPGFSPPLAGIDQILVRGLELLSGPEAWPRGRRRVGAVLLSDHAPVEARVAVASDAA